MAKNGAKIDRKRELAIVALLTSATQESAAKKSGVALSTLRRWLADEDFQEDYRAARQTALTQATTYLQGVAADAIETLHVIMLDAEAPANARVTAARSVIELALKTAEMNTLEERLTALEQMVPSNTGRRWAL